MKSKLILKITSSIILVFTSIICYSQSNQYDDSQKKHGSWIENGITGEYAHGNKIGKWTYSNRIEEFDVNGIMTKQVLYFDENPNTIQSIKGFKNGQLIYHELYGQVYSKDVPLLRFKKNYFIDKDGDTEFTDYDGLQVEMNQNFKKEDLYEKGKLLESKVYYKNSSQPLVVTTFNMHQKMGRQYVGLLSKRTFYYSNGTKRMEYDPSLFVEFDESNTHLSIFPSSLDPTIYANTEAPFTVSSNPFSFGTGLYSGQITYKKKLDSVLVINVYDENGKVIKELIYHLTNKKSDYFKVSSGHFYYGIHGTYLGQKYYKGLPDSIRLETGLDKSTLFLRVISEYNKGILAKTEQYCCLNIANSGKDFNVLQTSYDNSGIIDGSQKSYYLKANTIQEKIYNHGKIKAEPPLIKGDFQSYFPNIYKMYSLKIVGTGYTKEGFIYSENMDEKKERKKKKISFGDVLNVIKE